jgi:hypothetical protein
MAKQAELPQVTDMQGLLPIVRQCISELITQRTGSSDISLDVYREWSGGWRVAAEVRGPVSGHMDFILFHTPQGGVLAMPARMPERWRAQGIAASDGTRWTMDEEGRLLALDSAG